MSSIIFPRPIRTILLSTIGMLIGHFLAVGAERFITLAKADTKSVDSIATKSLEIVDSQGRRRILMAASENGNPGIWFFDKRGKNRLTLGLYSDDNAYIVLNDENNQAVQIFRTVGGSNSPALVMKSNGQDRIVMGLNFNGPPDPFFVFYDSKGTKNTVFGNY